MAVGQEDASAAVIRRLTDERHENRSSPGLGTHFRLRSGFHRSGSHNFLAVHLGANALVTADYVDQAHETPVKASLGISLI